MMMPAELEVIYRAQSVSLVRFAYTFVRDKSAAEDIVHDAFLKATAYWWNRPHTHLLGWIQVIVKNLCKDWVKDIRRRHPSYEKDDHPSSWHTPEQQVSLDEVGRAILFALQQLNPSMLHAFLRHHVDDEPLKIVAAELGISVGATKMRVSRARHMLQSSLLPFRDFAV